MAGMAPRMLCPCCGQSVHVEALECVCGARFVGPPLDRTPVSLPKYGPLVLAAVSFAAVITCVLVFSTWFGFATLLVLLASGRAFNLARRHPDAYGGRRLAQVFLCVTIIGGLTGAGVALYSVPRLLDLREERSLAHTRAGMHRIARLLDEYKREYGSYPSNLQALKKTRSEPLPTDFWESSIRYQSYTEAIAGRLPGVTGINFNNFELRSAGPDGLVGTADDVVMRDGLFFSGREVERQPVATDLGAH